MAEENIFFSGFESGRTGQLFIAGPAAATILSDFRRGMSIKVERPMEICGDTGKIPAAKPAFRRALSLPPNLAKSLTSVAFAQS